MNRIVFKILLFMLSMGIFTGLYAQNGNVLDININDEDLELEVASFKTWSRNSQTYYGVGALKTYDDLDKAVMMYTATMTQIGHTDILGVSFGIGFKGVHAGFDHNGSRQSASAIGVRVKAYYTLPLKVKSVIEGGYNYAPKSLAFSKDLKSYSEYRVVINAEPIEGAWVYAGIRGVNFAFDNIDETYTLNQSAFAGMKIYF